MCIFYSVTECYNILKTLSLKCSSKSLHHHCSWAEYDNKTSKTDSILRCHSNYWILFLLSMFYCCEMYTLPIVYKRRSFRKTERSNEFAFSFIQHIWIIQTSLEH